MDKKRLIHWRDTTSQLTKGLNGDRCGWICRKLRQIASLVSNIPIIGASLSQKISLVADIVSAAEDLFSKTETIDYVPTPAEAVILDQWQLNKLSPFYRELTMDLSDGFQQANLQDQIAIINEVLEKMCVVKSYFFNNETTGLSSMAIQLRNELIDKIFEPLYELIEDSFDNYSIETINTNVKLDNSTIALYSPLITGYKDLNYNCLNYSLENSTQNPSTINPAPIVTSTPNSTQTVVKKSDNTMLWLGVAFAGIVAITIFYDDKKKIT